MESDLTGLRLVVLNISSVKGQHQKVLGRNVLGTKTSANAQAEPALIVPFQSITTIKSEQFILNILNVYSDNRSAAGIIVFCCN